MKVQVKLCNEGYEMYVIPFLHRRTNKVVYYRFIGFSIAILSRRTNTSICSII